MSATSEFATITMNSRMGKSPITVKYIWLSIDVLSMDPMVSMRSVDTPMVANMVFIMSSISRSSPLNTPFSCPSAYTYSNCST